MTLLALLAPVAVLTAQGSPSQGADVSIGVRFGTLGIGPEISKLVTPHIGLRAGINFFSESHTFTESNANVDATLKLKAFTGLVDLYPGARGSFHFTAGIITNPLTVTGSGTPSGNITINNHQYTAAQVGAMTLTGEWPSASPYVGLGFGTAAASHSAFHFAFDVGAAIGKSTIKLASAGAASNSTLQSDLTAQASTIQNKVPVYPVIAFGLGYRF
ncbi:MAG: hypothetical protein ABI442_02315 [Gemmatimonadaceae bacterium]